VEDDDENEGGVGFNWVCCSTFQLDMLFYLFIFTKKRVYVWVVWFLLKDS